MSSPLWEQARIAVRDRDTATLSKLATDVVEAKISEPERNAILALLEASRDEYDAAKKRLIGASKKRKLDEHEKLVLGFMILDTDPAKAKKLFGEAAKAKLKDPRIPEGLGITAVDRGFVDDGIRLLSRAVADDEKSWSARYALGMAKSTKGDAAGARADFEAVAKMRPEFEPAWLGYAAMSIQCGRAGEASQVLGQLIKVSGPREKLFYAYVDCLAAAGDVAKALAVLTPVTNASRDPALLFDYVELCIVGNFLDPALKTLRKIDTIKPKMARTWVLRGQVYERSEPKMLDEAIAAYEQALAFDPTYGRAKNALALALIRANEGKNLDKAAQLLSAAAKDEADASSTIALSNLAQLRFSEGRKKDAKRLAEGVLKRKGAPAGALAQAQKIIEFCS
jgi:Flp pilus assembly protein TadD